MIEIQYPNGMKAVWELTGDCFWDDNATQLFLMGWDKESFIAAWCAERVRHGQQVDDINIRVANFKQWCHKMVSEPRP